MGDSFIQIIETSIKENWNLSALTDFKGETSTYKDVARKIEKIHILYKAAGIKKGDKIALCSRNCSNWGIVYLATLTYGAVAVAILNEFKPDNILHIVNHSEAKLFFVGDVVWENLDASTLTGVEGILRMEDFSLRMGNKSLSEARNNLNALFGQAFPERFTAEDVNYEKENIDDLAMLNYTSGTTSASKGVMLTYRSLWSNMEFAFYALGKHQGEQVVSMLPMAHMYGLSFEFLYEFSSGMHVHFLTRTPSPKIIGDAFAEVKPYVIITVPLVIEKIIRKNVFPIIEKPHMKLLMNIPLVNSKIKDTIRQQVMDALGGHFKELIIGGAALNKDVESFLQAIHFPYTVGYGMTECGPILAYDDWSTFKKGSCGKAAPRMELKIDSPDPQNIVGEILAKGDNVMIGYFNNDDATRQTIDKDGWLHTGDLGLIDADGYLFIKGRSKNMILGPSGQNIYPEEIEDKINNMTYVIESIVIEKEGKLKALIYPDFDALSRDGFNEESKIRQVLNDYMKETNKELPAYSQIADIQIFNEEFEKTPKRSIKRFLYQ